MSTFSEKDMEDAIAASPEKFVGEQGLKLIHQQLRIENFILDLVFEDKYGHTLIVEIQKGTLDRAHTHKIREYFHRYKTLYPRLIVDLMVIANLIPAERKEMLSDLGIEYREIHSKNFLKEEDEKILNNVVKD